jgi:hypothetical protein
MQLGILADGPVDLDQEPAFLEAAELFVKIGGGLLGAHGVDPVLKFAGLMPASFPLL